MDVDVERLHALIEAEPDSLATRPVTLTAGEAQALVELLGVLVVSRAGGDEVGQVAQSLALDVARRIPVAS
ncbi:hypothetical protein ACFV3R_25015 [Streptomyces sp. NPDC059740]|uniref:hypothetical protein n=1 Tax=Streptomyces sp. NPDC059740 TaxID=3346926 RepID=UPI0036513EA3